MMNVYAHAHELPEGASHCDLYLGLLDNLELTQRAIAERRQLAERAMHAEFAIVGFHEWGARDDRVIETALDVMLRLRGYEGALRYCKLIGQRFESYSPRRQRGLRRRFEREILPPMPPPLVSQRERLWRRVRDRLRGEK